MIIIHIYIYNTVHFFRFLTYSLSSLWMYGTANFLQDSVLAQFTWKCSLLSTSHWFDRTCWLIGNNSECTGCSRLFSPNFKHLACLLSLNLSKSKVCSASSQLTQAKSLNRTIGPPPPGICWIESSVYRCLLGRTYTYYKYVGNVWSDLLVLHNYCVIIFNCQKGTFWGVEANKFVK